MKRFSFMYIAVVLGMVACSQQLDPATDDVTDADIDTDTDSDTDTDTDTDTDSDTDTDTDSDTDTDPGVDCNADYSAFVTAPAPDECVTESLTLNEEWVYGTVEGGNNYYTSYNGNGHLACNGGFNIDEDYSGPERVYHLTGVDAGRAVYVELDTPCESLRIAVVDAAGADLDVCPHIANCRAPYHSDVVDGDSRLTVNQTAGSSTWSFLVIIESIDGADVGNFRVRAGYR